MRSAMAMLVGLLACAVSLGAQVGDTVAYPTTVRYDADSTTVTYCVAQGWRSGFGLGIPGPLSIKTTAGPTTTVTSQTLASGALTPVVARDVLLIGTVSKVTDVFTAGWAAVITAKSDDDTVTVDPAVTWDAGYAYTYLHPVCGTTANDGWVDVSGAEKASLTIQYDQGDLDNLSWRFECKQNTPGSVPITVYPSEGDDCGIAGTLAGGFCDFATAGPTANLTWEEFGAWGSCRIGFKVKTTDTSDAGAALERVTGSIAVTRATGD